MSASFLPPPPPFLHVSCRVHPSVTHDPSHKYSLLSRLIFPLDVARTLTALFPACSAKALPFTGQTKQIWMPNLRDLTLYFRSATLTQKKYVGSNPLPPPRSSSPLPPGGPERSPSRLARPGFMISGPSNRVPSPTFGRPGAPSFSSAMNRSSLQGSGLRPPSSLSFHHTDCEPVESTTPGGDGDWVTVVLKFHFVDLAGPERVRFISSDSAFV